MKSLTVSYWKKKCWTLFSLYIRIRDSDWRGNATCVTCGLTKHYKQMQAGHFIPGRHNSILFDERNVHAQCYGCNVMKQGNSIKYFRFMQQQYGDAVIEELERLDRENKQFTIPELETLYEAIKEKLKKLPS